MTLDPIDPVNVEQASAGPTLFEIDIEMLRGTRRLTTHLPGDSGAAGADSFTIG